LIRKDRPFSVTAIAIFTLVSNIILVSTFGLAELELINTIFITTVFLLQMYALVISILLLLYNSKYVWYASVSFWGIVIVTCLVTGFVAYFWGLNIIFFALPFLVASFVCLVLFNRETVKSYFGVKRTRQIPV